MSPLDPMKCTRCKVLVPVDDEKRPESIRSFVWAPINPRPKMPSGTEITWEVEADCHRRGRIAGMLCSDCADDLLNWVFGYEPSPR